jgi:hypothetical protein
VKKHLTLAAYPPEVPWPGDVLVSRHTAFPAPQIRWLTTSFRERRDGAPTWGSHVGIMLSPWGLAEANWHGTELSSYQGRYSSIKHRIYRMMEHPDGRPLTWADRLELSVLAEMQIGKPYGYPTLVLHAIDGLLNKAWPWRELFLARRLSTSRWLAICSQIVARTYWYWSSYIFGVTPEWADPDHIDKHCASSGWWTLVKEGYAP